MRGLCLGLKTNALLGPSYLLKLLLSINQTGTEKKVQLSLETSSFQEKKKKQPQTPSPSGRKETKNQNY